MNNFLLESTPLVDAIFNTVTAHSRIILTSGRWYRVDVGLDRPLNHLRYFDNRTATEMARAIRPAVTPTTPRDNAH